MSALKSRLQKLRLTPAMVTEVEQLSPNLRRIRLQSRALRGCRWQPGEKIKVAAGGPKPRSYTPARVDAVAGWMDVVFHLHGNGAASDWASSAAVGDRTGYLGPARSMPALTVVPDWAIFLGDETTIGLAAALVESLPQTVPVSGAIEVAAADAGALAAFELALSAVVRTGWHGDALLSWLEAQDLPSGAGVVWLSGEATSVCRLRDALLARGLTRSQLKIKPYWSLRGHTHRKTLQKTL